MVPNFSLKSLAASWAERHRIADLPAFSKGVGRLRSLARRAPGGGGSPPADALAALQLGDGPTTAGAAARPDRLYPSLSRVQEGPDGLEPAGPQQQRRQGAASPPPAPAVPPNPYDRPDLYPSLQPGASPPASRQAQAEAALNALRDVAAPGGGAGGNRGAAPYHAWALLQLAGDAEGRRMLWEVGASARCPPGCSRRAAPRCSRHSGPPDAGPASTARTCPAPSTAGQRSPPVHLSTGPAAAAGGVGAGCSQARPLRHAAALGGARRR